MNSTAIINQKRLDLDRLLYEKSSISPKLALHGILSERAKKLAEEIKSLGGDTSKFSKGTMTRLVLAKRAKKRAAKLMTNDD